MFSSTNTLFSDAILKEENVLLKMVDFNECSRKIIDFVKKYYHFNLNEWLVFNQALFQYEGEKTEKLFIIKTVLRCLKHSVTSAEMAQFLTLTQHLKSVNGVRLIYILLKAEPSLQERKIHSYLTILQYLIELHDQPGIVDFIKKYLPVLSNLVLALQKKHADYIASLFPIYDVDTTFKRFETKDSIVQFPLSRQELDNLKIEYDKLSLKTNLEKLQQVSDLETVRNKYHLIPVIIEAIRRQYHIMPYATQIISLLALIHYPVKLKGRIAQIKTGEGKSTIIAMLAAYQGCLGNFVDIVTSSSYLSKRDCEKYKPFFALLGLTVSHISYIHPEQHHFHGQILYGTNTDFEFAFMKQRLYNIQLCYSKKCDGKLEPRTLDVLIADEVDNLFLDTALNSARLAIPSQEDIHWIYAPIFQYVKEIPAPTVTGLSLYLKHIESRYHEILSKIPNIQLKKWLNSALRALNDMHNGQHYIVKNNDIVIVDYANTGRLNEGCQWQHGLHQMLQVKEGLPVRAETLTASSIAHSTYFNGYRNIFGVTGTMGEDVERNEIQKIYVIDSIDVPTHLPSKRNKLVDTICDETEQFQKIYDEILAMQKQKRPLLILFKTVKESCHFSEYLLSRSSTLKHQLINETQRTEESYMIMKAGFPCAITIATNTAGRGTDIILSPASIKAGGLHVIFAFFPDNLRVEIQGFGRAGRQGQPGSCCMILKMQDETIQKLLKQFNSLGEQRTFSKYDKVMQLEESFIHFLKQCRTQAITKQSLYRYHSSQREAIFFAKLMSFFDSLKQLNQLFKDDHFKTKFLTACQSESLLAGSSSYEFTHKLWMPELEIAQTLLEKKYQDCSVDWKGFYEQFTDTYLSYVKHLWAIFYTKIQDDIQDESLDIINQQVDAAYADVMTQLHPYLANPEANVIACLNALLLTASQHLLDHTHKIYNKFKI